MKLKEIINEKVVLPIVLAFGISVTQAGAIESNYKANISYSTENRMGLNFGTEALILQENISTFVEAEAELASSTINFGIGITPNESDNFCPYLSFGVSGQGILVTDITPKFSFYYKLGLGKYIDEGKLLFLEYQERNIKTDAIDLGEHRHNNQVRMGLKIEH